MEFLTGSESGDLELFRALRGEQHERLIGFMAAIIIQARQAIPNLMISNEFDLIAPYSHGAQEHGWVQRNERGAFIIALNPQTFPAS